MIAGRTLLVAGEQPPKPRTSLAA